MQNWKTTLAYDGTAFHGWQIQPGLPTVQAELQAALGRICGETPLPQGSGRTDAGVHALGQVASFSLEAPIPADNLMRALNRTLPASIRIREARVVSEEFHARHSAVAKTYEYRIFRGDLCSPFLAPYVHPCTWRLDHAALDEAAATVVGEHDFASLAASDPDAGSRATDSGELRNESRNEARDKPRDESRTTVRTIFSSQWTVESSEAQGEMLGGMLIYRVRGNGFLHHMVRNLVGTMLEIGRGQFPAGSMARILDAKARSAAGPTAPAKGLFLHSVEYPKAMELLS